MEDPIKRIEQMKDEYLEFKKPRDRRIFIKIKREDMKKFLSFLVNDLNIKHLSTITGIDTGKEMELLYHFAYNNSVAITIKISIPREDLRVPTITDIVPGAIFYEQEVHDMFGIVFEGHPDLSPLILPEGWPEGIYPLRKEYTIEQLREGLKK
ncbi:MAG: NADH-quinone oxidoreductase subunit C [Candidatus Methanomethyliaceae archaeon]|nr:NADH-quinone oxidoreductase subunit C [Candidatus Methanomethyliaceae archaeon]MCX8169521.1 NADH-quinone oxidoreductase subunit C [Candidatus Methanomethyliaceae archaeon]MDW7971325.1 NADH-quinone oxidoreductase subunit C [Nitrososphaerota archaeon]